jgi:hypothetical protein
MCLLLAGLTIPSMNIRDERAVGEQVKAGFRLAGWVLSTLALIFLLLGSTASLLGKGSYTQPIHRVLAACCLLTVVTLMFVTVRRWVKWLLGVLAFLVLKTAISLLLGFNPSAPSITRPRIVFLEYLVILVFVTLLCARYVSQTPHQAEKVGLLSLVMALSFSVILDSALPILGAAMLLGLIQLVHGRWHPHTQPT